MATYQTFTSARTTEPDQASLLALLRAQEPTAGIQHRVGETTYVVKRSTDVAWTAPEIAFVQNAIDSAPAASPARTAQANILAWPVEFRALVLALVDQLNVLRAAQTPPLQAITPAQALAAVVAKAGTLT